MLMINKELSSPPVMDQFIYECFGKTADFKIIPQLEEQKITEGISKYKRDREIDDSNNDSFERTHQTVKYPSNKYLKDRITSKYGSFLED